MDKYLIPPEEGVLLLAFKKNSTIREAAQVLGCDPGGLLRKIHRMAAAYGVLEKIRGRWQLTQKGAQLIVWIEDSMRSQKKLLQATPPIRLATTMWLSEQVIIPYLAQLKSESPVAIATPMKSLEQEMILGQSDFVIACHPPHDPLIAHKKILKEDYSIIMPRSWQREIKNKSETQFLEMLAKRPYIRHDYLNPDVFLDYFANRKIECEITVDHLIGVRAAVVSELGWSCVPRLLVKDALETNRLIERKLQVRQSESHLCLWWRRNQRDSKKMVESLTEWLKIACRMN
ncbi:MAG: substrate-binding domain-containing protein [Bdellovibrionaceae bacterium]|nr:substrate-binding domain-containing protein [Pseudobdellovibrionaceae bacterium]